MQKNSACVRHRKQRWAPAAGPYIRLGHKVESPAGWLVILILPRNTLNKQVTKATSLRNADS